MKHDGWDDSELKFNLADMIAVIFGLAVFSIYVVGLITIIRWIF